MISQLMDGLGVCGVLQAVKAHPHELKPLFCVRSTQGSLDEDMFLGMLKVNYSQEQTKRLKEIDTYKCFADYVGMLYNEGN